MATGRGAGAVTHPAYAPGTASGLDVDPAKGPVETRVVLTQGGRIEGRVRTRSGVLPPGAAIYVNPSGRRRLGLGAAHADPWRPTARSSSSTSPRDTPA